MSEKMVRIVIGVSICKATAFVIDEFLKNQEEIKENYPDSELVFATEDYDKELKKKLKKYDLDYKILKFESKKAYDVSNIAIARELIRKYFLTTKADYYLAMDADIIFDPHVINILIGKKESEGVEVIFDGYPPDNPKTENIALLSGMGCTLLTRKVAEKIPFRYEYGFLAEDSCYDEDLLRNDIKVLRGIFVSLRHYSKRHPGTYYEITPRKINPIENSKLALVYLLRKFSFFTGLRADKYLICKLWPKLKVGVLKKI